MTLPDLAAGNCHNDPDPDMWHRHDVTRVDAADLCAGCPVLTVCLTYAIDNPAQTNTGIWGGMTEQDRATMRRRLKGASPRPPVIRGMRCKRDHDLTLPGATYKQRSPVTGNVWETCAECKRLREKMRGERIRAAKG